MVFSDISDLSSGLVSRLDKGNLAVRRTHVLSFLKCDSSQMLHMEVLPRYQVMWKAERIN